MFTYKIPIRDKKVSIIKDLSPEVVSETFSSRIIQYVQFIWTFQIQSKKRGPCKMCSFIIK